MVKASKSSTGVKSKVLIVIPTLGDRLDMLSQTLQSLIDQKPQAPDVYLVCPPGNTKLERLAAKFGALTIKDPSAGMSAALNAGFERAKPWHEYASWLGDDDLLRPESIAITTTVLNDNPKAVLAYGHCDYIDDKGKIIFTSKAGTLAPWLMTWGPNLLPLIGILYRLSSAQQAGGYNTSLKYSMDLDMWLRLRQHGNFINTNKTLGAFRWHSASTTVSNREASLTEAEMVKRRYLPKPLKIIAPIWEAPVKLATRVAVYRVNSKARNKASP